MSQTERNYELLVRFHPDGKVGASIQSITEVTGEDGTIIGNVHNSPRELTFYELSQLVYGIKLEDWYTPPVSEDSEL